MRFRQSEMKVISSAEQNKAGPAPHEIASESEINMFANERAMARYYEVSESVDNSLKNSYG